MWGMFNLSRKRQEKLEAIEARKTLLEEKNAKESLGMQTTYCPIMGDNCSDRCIHFKKGSVYKVYLLDTDGQYVREAPACKLWRYE